MSSFVDVKVILFPALIAGFVALSAACKSEPSPSIVTSFPPFTMSLITISAPFAIITSFDASILPTSISPLVSIFIFAPSAFASAFNSPPAATFTSLSVVPMSPVVAFNVTSSPAWIPSDVSALSCKIFPASTSTSFPAVIVPTVNSSFPLIYTPPFSASASNLPPTSTLK